MGNAEKARPGILFMSHPPLVSVIMTVYNGEPYLQEAIQSILSQTYENLEFVIVNDASTDKTPQILTQAKSKDTRIKVLNNSKNLGVAASLNNGIKASTGQFIARMDSDDIAHPARLKHQVHYLKKHPDIYLVGTSSIFINSKGDPIRSINVLTGPDLIKEKLVKNNQFVHPSIMFRNTRDVFYRNKFRYSQDYDFFLNLLSTGKKLDNLNVPLMYYRIDGESISNSKSYQQHLFSEKAKELYGERSQTGVDTYDTWDPSSILNPTQEQLDKPEVLFFQMGSYGNLHQYKKVRKLVLKKMKKHGICRKSVYLYLSSYPKQIIYKFGLANTLFNILRKFNIRKYG